MVYYFSEDESSIKKNYQCHISNVNLESSHTRYNYHKM